MALIRQINESEAKGILKEVYDAAVGRSGQVANIIKVMSLDARTVRASMKFYTALMKSKNALEPARREMLAAVVSNVNECYYWTLSHAQDFGRESGNKQLAEQLVYDFREAALDPADRALCDYAVKVTVAPSTITRSDIETLRQNGFSDEAITIAAQVIGYFNYITRIAEGLGVDDEEGMTPSREEWNRRRGRRYLKS